MAKFKPTQVRGPAPKGRYEPRGRPAEFCGLFEQYAERLTEPSATDLYRQFVPWLISRGRPVGAFDIQQAAPDLGTPERLRHFGR